MTLDDATATLYAREINCASSARGYAKPRPSHTPGTLKRSLLLRFTADHGYGTQRRRRADP